ncbi:IclR family transcriptional regulator [Roseomonas sp. E05]|uniref:IclR family transcriptional regulator n=1 Tax=Roseomonas sp. E05 TaxID=3046310 RepID=UPI0024B8DB9C|nr:IclR family transcriptional regulator [Roseomonas sp. E05]MDJ0391046.1 IclR family transcriptional regulator [Roseomonas sp. E05]
MPPRATGTQAFDRAIDLLFAIAEASDGLRITDIAATSGLSVATAHRLVQGLARRGLVDQLPENKRFVLGLRFLSLAARHREPGGLVVAARPSVLRTVAATGDCVFLMAPSGFDAVCVDRQDGGYTIRSLTGGIGGVTPLGLGPGSLAILSHLPPKEREVVLEHNAPRIAQLGGQVPSERDMEQVRRDGHVYDAGPILPGVTGVAVPILSPRGHPVGSLGIGAIAPRLEADRVPEVVGLLKAEVSRMSEALFAEPAPRQGSPSSTSVGRNRGLGDPVG